MQIDCGSCGASLRLEAHLRTASCPYCASPQVVEHPAALDRPAPTFTVGFTIGHEQARGAVRTWQKSRGLFTHSGMKSAAIDSIQGLYVPAYLYTAIANSSYQAEIGEDYQETETYTTTDSNGNTVTRTRTVTKTEWRSLHGRHASYVMDVIVTASRGISHAELELVEPFDLKALRRYTPALLSGWIAEDPTMTVAECLELARGETLQKVGAELRGFMPGDSHRDLHFQTALERETYDLVHVPLWILAVRHDPTKPAVRLIVNGQTAKVWGKAPLSWIKITIAVLAVLLPIGGLVLWVALTHDTEPDAPDRAPSSMFLQPSPARRSP